MPGIFSLGKLQNSIKSKASHNINRTITLKIMFDIFGDFLFEKIPNVKVKYTFK